MTTKRHSLEQHDSLNRRPETVHDPLFVEHDFFDPEDLVQVKYEMLRRVRVEGAEVSETAARFGFSRPSFYAARERFECEGLAGIIPRRSGPHAGHKLSEEVIDFLEEVLMEASSTRPSQLAEQVQQRFGLQVHPRSIERALQRRRKKNSSQRRA